ncbi:MAG TPA: cation-translocating P-type ATPase [Halalkalibaculum sp.]|nr:cation-translocating P-type ATPase [Halalkalibaculum sp.]
MEKKELEITIKGMDCAGCVRSVKSALEKMEGVDSAEVLLSSEKARLSSKSSLPDLPALKKTVEDIGYRVVEKQGEESSRPTEELAKKSFRLFGLVFGAILAVIVAGEWLGLFQTVTDYIPFWAGTAFVLAMGYPVFIQVIKAAINYRVTPHALMALGALAALAAGEWVTAAIVVFFMRTGDYIEGYTTEKARDSIRSLTELAPKQATVIRDGKEHEVSVDHVHPGDTILVRPGGSIPVDGTVFEGSATVDQSPITGESMPVEVSAGSEVYASTIAQGGRILVKAEAIGRDSTFGKIIQMVEDAESKKGKVQRIADRFSAWYLPVVAGIALLTYIFSGDLMATVAVMVVACSCAFALATPVALLASIGSNAKRGLLIKGGKYIEALAKADVLLLDKTGTLTFGRPSIDEVIPVNGCSREELLRLAGSAEFYSEHPLGKAIVTAARNENLSLIKPRNFESLTGNGVKARIEQGIITVGNERLLNGGAEFDHRIKQLKNSGNTVITVQQDDKLIGLLTARDTERKEAGAAIDQIKSFGFSHIELLTGDNTETAKDLAGRMGIGYRAELLPEDKIEIVKKFQSQGKTVVMIGDGVNDAPALAQADVGIAMGTTGTDVAIETADIILLRDDWTLIPRLFESVQKTMTVIKWNFGFTTAYNIVGLSLAAVGILPPILAAAAQSLPDIGIMANSSRLLKK